jgi:hypothetical protein
VLCFRGYHSCSHSIVSLYFVSEGIIAVLILWYCCALFRVNYTILWEQLWYPRKQSTALPYYENSYDSLETKHSDTILWEQLWYPRKQSTAIQYYENSYDTLGNKAQRYHTKRTVMIPSEISTFRGYHNCSHSMVLLCFVSEGILAVLIVWYCCALFPRELQLFS